MSEKIKEAGLNLFAGDPAVEVVETPTAPCPTMSVSIRPTLTSMDIGDTVHFPIEKMRSVRAIASDLGVIQQRKYRTRIDRTARTVTVCRTE